MYSLCTSKSAHYESNPSLATKISKKRELKAQKTQSEQGRNYSKIYVN